MLELHHVFMANYGHNSTTSLESNAEELRRLNDDLTGKLAGFEAMSDCVSAVATEIGLAYGGEDSECMMSVRDLHHISRERSVDPVSGDRAQERCLDEYWSLGSIRMKGRKDHGFCICGQSVLGRNTLCKRG